MVLYSDRRMRLAAEEVAPIMELVRLRLHELAETRMDLQAAELLFRPLWRFHYPYWGRPGYPEPVTWADIQGLLNNGPLIAEEGALEGVGGDLPEHPQGKHSGGEHSPPDNRDQGGVAGGGG